MLPKKILHEKERLYAEIIELKQVINGMAEKNMKLQTRISVLENKLKKVV